MSSYLDFKTSSMQSIFTEHSLEVYIWFIDVECYIFPELDHKITRDVISQTQYLSISGSTCREKYPSQVEVFIILIINYF